jgi:O-antigen/teichoic acid export membrane protein
VLAPDVVPWIFGSGWRGAVEPPQLLAVAGAWTILLAAIDAPLMAVGRPAALAIVNFAMMVGAGTTAWFTAPMGITAVAVGIAISQLVLLYVVCLRVVSPPAWRDLRTLFVRVLGARRLLPKLSSSPQRV